MKQWIAFVFAVACILSLAGCGGKGEAVSPSLTVESAGQSRETPPSLTVKCGDQGSEALLGTYSWSSEGEKCGSRQ